MQHKINEKNKIYLRPRDFLEDLKGQIRSDTAVSRKYFAIQISLNDDIYSKYFAN